MLPALPDRDHDLPRCMPWSPHLGRILMGLAGWKPIGTLPKGTRSAIVLSYPHTTNWDFWWALLATWMFGVKMSWMGKQQLFDGPWGWFLVKLGGVPVDRSKPNGLVGQVAERLKGEEPMLLLVPAEGTRSYREHWKSGFYWIALEAGVPLVLGTLDYTRKEAGFLATIQPTGDIKTDMDAMRAVYEPRAVTAKFPDKASPVRLRQEMEEG